MSHEIAVLLLLLLFSNCRLPGMASTLQETPPEPQAAGPGARCPSCPSCPPAPAAGGVSGQRSRSLLARRRPSPLRVSGGKRAPAAGDSEHPDRSSARRPRPRRALGACQAGRRCGRRCRALPRELRRQGGKAEVSRRG